MFLSIQMYAIGKTGMNLSRILTQYGALLVCIRALGDRERVLEVINTFNVSSDVQMLYFPHLKYIL